jgi:hypothetical protein
MGQIEYWTYSAKDTNAYIWFDGQSRYIKISKNDLRKMLDWIDTDKKLKILDSRNA